MSSSMTLNKLKNRIKNGFYSTRQLKGLRRDYTKYLSEGIGKDMQRKLDAVKEALIEDTISKDVTITHKPEPDEEPLDIKVAKKILQLKKSADSRGKEFSLSLSDVRRLLTRKTCFFTGVRFEEEGVMSRSVDRLDSSLGYVKGNVVACTIWANQQKEHLYESPNAKIKMMLKLINKVEELGLDER